MLRAHRYLLTDVLKGELGGAGFVVSGWEAIDQIDKDFYTRVTTSVNAGLDMVPFDFRRFIDTLTWAVEAGDVPLAAQGRRGGPAEQRVSENVATLGYTGCGARAEGTLHTIIGGTPSWPGSDDKTATQEVNASQLTWNFFKAHPKRE